jgi:hypothetical protein
MRLCKETVCGQLYYTVKPGLTRPWQEIVAWCARTYGPSTAILDRWGQNRIIVSGGKLWFRDEQDLAWFNLKWA